MIIVSGLHWVTAVQYALYQSDVRYSEWCDLYYYHARPTVEQIERACATALPILKRNNIIAQNVQGFHGMNSAPETWPRRDDPNPRDLVWANE